MKTATLSEIKKELDHLKPQELLNLCIALAKYKKETKEYLGYLLFEAHNKRDFLNDLKKEIDEHFMNLSPHLNLYYVKKSLRKLLRYLLKYTRYADDKTLTVEVYIYFCLQLKKSGIPYQNSQLLVNLMAQQIKKINSIINTLHPDLQNDFVKDLEVLIN